MTKDVLEKELAGFSRNKIAARWGEPAEELSGMDGESYSLNGEKTLIVYYGGENS